MKRKNVLLCFDAFGTLFRPKQPAPKQYADVARKYGLGGFSDDDMVQSFKQAFKEESRLNPNYGKATDMGSQKWWTNIIEKTFFPFVPGEDKKLPPVLAPALIHRFSSKEGYDLFPDAASLFRRLADNKTSFGRIDQQDHHDSPEGQPAKPRLVVGVITNSDDRVPDVLASLGLRVKPLRHGEDPRPFHPTSEPADVDFAIMSYDVGHEKPDARIFRAGEAMLTEMLAAEGHSKTDIDEWRKVYVGDDVRKDVEGALDAGWDAILVDRDPGHDIEGVNIKCQLPDGREAPSIRDLNALLELIG